MRARAMLAGIAVVACVAVLLIDDVVARHRAPLDEKLIKSLQQQVKSDATLAIKLAEEQKRVTTARLARKSRDNGVAYVLIAAVIVFLTCGKRLLRERGSGSSTAKSAPLRSRLSNGLSEAHAPLEARLAAAPVNLAYVDEMVSQLGRGKEAAIPLLQAIQAHYGYLPDEAMRRLCELTEITPGQIAGTSSFYERFRRTPSGKHMVRVCHGTACHVAGARQVTEELRRYLAIPDGDDTDAARIFTVNEVACLGCCSLAPVLMVNNQAAGRLTPSSARDALMPYEQRETA